MAEPYIDTIQDKDGNDVYPVTKTEAVWSKNGERLDNVIITRGKKHVATTPVPRDADTLDGHDPSYYAKSTDLSELGKVFVIANDVSGNTSFTMPTQYLTDEYDIDVISQVTVGSITYRSTKTSKGSTFIGAKAYDISLCDGCYATASFNRFVEWSIPKDSSIMKLNAFWVNGTNHVAIARTWVTARKLQN